MLQYEVIAYSALCQGSSRPTQSSQFAFCYCIFKWWSGIDEHSNIMLVYPWARCYPRWGGFAFQIWVLFSFLYTWCYQWCHVCGMLCFIRQTLCNTYDDKSCSSFSFTTPMWFDSFIRVKPLLICLKNCSRAYFSFGRCISSTLHRRLNLSRQLRRFHLNDNQSLREWTQHIIWADKRMNKH